MATCEYRKDQLAGPEARAFAGACARVFGESARPSQLRIANTILEESYSSSLRVESTHPLGAEEASELVTSEAQRHLLVDLLVLVQMCARSCTPRPLHARSLSRFVEGLGVEEAQVRIANLSALGLYDDMEREWRRLREAPRQGPELVEETANAREQLRRLSDCAPGTLGRGIYDFCRSRDLPLPGEESYGRLRYVQHDAQHVITGYGTTGAEEIAIQALMVRAEGGRECSRLTGLLGLYELGRMEPCFEGLEPQRGCATSRQGRKLIAQAFARGAYVDAGICDLDVLAALDEPLSELRRRFAISGKR